MPEGGGTQQKNIFGDNYFNPSVALDMVSVDELYPSSAFSVIIQISKLGMCRNTFAVIGITHCCAKL